MSKKISIEAVCLLLEQKGKKTEGLLTLADGSLVKFSTKGYGIFSSNEKEQNNVAWLYDSMINNLPIFISGRIKKDLLTIENVKYYKKFAEAFNKKKPFTKMEVQYA